MAVSRREFLVGGQVLLAATAWPTKFLGAAIGTSLNPSKTANLQTMNMASFKPLVNSTFAVRTGAKTAAWFTLVSVEDLNVNETKHATSVAVAPKARKMLTPTSETFALHFQATGETLGQGTYELQHATLGQFSLFVVPAGTSAYTAVISHFTSVTPFVPPKPINSKGSLKIPTSLD